MRLEAPELDDGVVALRPPAPGDVDAIFEACQDREISRFTTVPWPYERAHAVRHVEESARAWRGGAGAVFVIVDTATGELLGSIGLVRLDRDAGVAEVGYWVKRGARGRGTAARGVRLLAPWVLCDLGFARLELQADVRNRASQRVAEKAGFRREGEVPAPERCAGRSETMVMFSLSRAGLRLAGHRGRAG
jgi:RimJ/RimL family protein N-acetyltransferase